MSFMRKGSASSLSCFRARMVLATKLASSCHGSLAIRQQSLPEATGAQRALHAPPGCPTLPL